MAVTTTPRAGVNRWSDPNDPFTRAQMDASHASIEALMAIDVQDLLANRPAPGTRGRFFSESSASAGLPGTTWRDDGATWRSVGSRVQANAASDVAQIARAAAGQTAHVAEWQSSGGSNIAYLDPSGGFVAGIGGGTSDFKAQTLHRTSNTGVPNVIIPALASQSADLTQWQNSGGSTIAALDSSGGLFAGSGYFGARAYYSAALSVTAPVASNIAAVLRGAASQTANLQEWQDSTGAVKTQVAGNGDLQLLTSAAFFGTASYLSAKVQVIPNVAAGERGIVVRGGSGQSANLQEWQNSSGTAMASVDPSGGIYVAQLQLTNPVGTTHQAVISFANNAVFGDPPSPGTGGGFLYDLSGALKYRGGNGTITTVANA